MVIETDFSDPDRNGERGPKFYYPKWLIMLIVYCCSIREIENQNVRSNS